MSENGWVDFEPFRFSDNHCPIEINKFYMYYNNYTFLGIYIIDTLILCIFVLFPGELRVCYKAVFRPHDRV